MQSPHDAGARSTVEPPAGAPEHVPRPRDTGKGTRDELDGRVHVRCRDGLVCDAVVEPYVDAATLHAAGEHVLADQYAATGDAVAARHGLWAQLESDVST